MLTNILPSPLLSADEARLLSPLTLAYIGDTVYDLIVRTSLLMGGEGTIKTMHRAAVQKVNACAQARGAAKLLPLFSEDEEAIYRRGRNAHSSHQAPKAATAAEYAASTGFEALLGYLYLIGRFERINELFLQMQRE